MRNTGAPLVVRMASAMAFMLVAAFGSAPGRADEGMWTFDHFPSATVGQKYGFAPSQAWLDHVRRASLRLTFGCSASFISPDGLVMTNHHCVVDCVQQLSTPEKNYVADGYLATTRAEERKCPAFEADQLVAIQNVTKTVRVALAGKHGNAATLAINAVTANLQQSCGKSPTVRCDLVSLYHGGVYDLYHYTRYDDLRLVFAPEYDVAQFGGDPDNFNFPRYDYDIGLLRVYVNGKPLEHNEYLSWSPHGSRPGQLVFVSGNPGGTDRELTMAQLAFERDTLYPDVLPRLAEFRGQLEQFVQRGPEQEREAHEVLFFIENAYKALIGRQQALNDPSFMAEKQGEEDRLRAAVRARPKLEAADGSAWAAIAGIQDVRARLFARDDADQALLQAGDLLDDAVALVRAATERTKPNDKRLPEYTNQALVALKQRLAAPIPMYKDLEQLELTFAFTLMRRDLGEDDPFVRTVLGTQTPAQLAERLVAGTALDDPKARMALYDGGTAAIGASTDPMIRFAALIDPRLRADRKQMEAEITDPTRAATQRIAAARFAISGTSIYPDATFTARLSYGTVKGFVDGQGHAVPPYTTIAGLYRRAIGADPYVLPKTWLDAKSSLDLATPMNLSTTNDIIGGNSGSPLIDSKADVVGLIFDSNIFGLGGDYGYDGSKNRAVSVDSRALIAGLRTVYHFDRIADEIERAAAH